MKLPIETLVEMTRDGYESGLFKSGKSWGQWVVMTADRIERDHRNFDRYGFLKACGVV